MMVMTVNDHIRLIAAEQFGKTVDEITRDTPIGSVDDAVRINDNTCLLLSMNINVVDASNCKTIGDYMDLVKRTIDARIAEIDGAGA